jgi:phospholipid/cholesterol/gamma-HCH transport system substrate-binding protein
VTVLQRRKQVGGQARRRRLPTPLVGLIAAVAGVVGLLASFQKLHILADIQSGRVITAVFADDYDNLIRPDWTKVEVAGVAKGVVTNLRVTHQGAAIVSMKVNQRVLDSLGSAPRASVELETLLGGNVYIQLYPGGRPGPFSGVIPASRTSTPVYLGRVLNAFTPDARAGLKTTITQLEGAMGHGGVSAADQLLGAAPGSLGPAGGVLEALEGTGPGQLTTLVEQLDQVTSTLAAGNDRLASILEGAGSVSRTLGDESPALAATVRHLPTVLNEAQGGLDNLQAVLANLRSVAGPLTPSASPLEQLLAQAQPTLQAALPVVEQLDPVLAQAAPLLAALAPTASSARALLGDIKGPVLNRVLNPVVPTLLEPYRGSRSTLYQEIGYMLTGLDGVGEMTDANGAMIDFNPGVNLETLAGLPILDPLSYHNSPQG